MNQILNMKLDGKSKKNGNYNNKDIKLKNKKIFNVQLILSILAICIFTSSFLYYKFSIKRQENFSNLLINNYNISQLYSESHSSQSTNEISDDTVIGLLKIPKFNISYTFFSGLNDNLLKISPCRFYGDMPSDNLDTNNMNLCIAGHNYDNDKFFSNIKKLENGDEIFIYDNNEKEYIYTVFKNYEVKNDDLSPIYTKLSNNLELTLVTCNNFNNKRIIIKAEKSVT